MRDKVLLALKMCIVSLGVVCTWLFLLPFVLNGSKWQGLGAITILLYATFIGVFWCLSDWMYYEQERKKKDKEKEE